MFGLMSGTAASISVAETYYDSSETGFTSVLDVYPTSSKKAAALLYGTYSTTVSTVLATLDFSGKKITYN
jgi:hypothetical protein